MPAYVIGCVTVEHAEGFAEYAQQVPGVVEQYGGRYLARGQAAEVFEGGWAEKRLAVLEFESVEAAKRWYESAEYQALAAIRQRCASTDLALVEAYKV
jgi:uncharacterized protein (DUF1330 family)